MPERVSRRAHLAAVGSTVALSGCVVGWDDITGNGGTSTGPTTDGRTPTGTVPGEWPENTPEPTVTVSADGAGDYGTFRDAYDASKPGDVVGLAAGTYTLGGIPTAKRGSLRYAAVETRGITVVGRGRARTTVALETDRDVLSVPDWEFWNLAVAANGSIVGPRDGKFRGCYVDARIMDPPGYASAEYLLDGGDASIASSGLAKRPSAERTYYGLAFDTVLDAVDDLGFDDTGSEPIDASFAEAYRSDTLVEFPPGEYLVADEHVGDDVSRFGIRGTGASRRDVRITPASGTALKWLKAVEAGPHLIENCSFDERRDETTQLSLWLQTTGGSVVRNVEWLGRTPDDSGLNYTVTAECADVDGVFVVDGIYAGIDEPAKQVAYPDGVVFLRGGPGHRGEVVLRNPVVHDRNSAATRYTKPTGVLTIQGGEFVNNQNANVRFGAGDHPSKVSSATGTHVRVDADSEGTSDAIRVDASSRGYAGAVFRDLQIEWKKPAGRGVVTFPAFGGHGRATFHGCAIHNDGAQTPTVAADAVPHDRDTVMPRRRAVVFENCSFTGSGGGFVADNRPGSVIRNSCIDMPNASVSGFATRNVSSTCRTSVDGTAKPTPTITATKRGGLAVDLSAADSTVRGERAVSYEWDVAGRTYTGPTASHTFPVAGTYSVALAVEYESGRTATAGSELVVNYPWLVRDPSG